MAQVRLLTHSSVDAVVVAHSSLVTQVMAKAMRAAMKGMRRRAMKKSVIAKGKRAKISVFKGHKTKTRNGLTKSDLTKNKNGKVVSRKASAAAKKKYASIRAWTVAVNKARKALNIKGFVAVNGKSPQGKALYAKAKSFF